MVKFDLFLRDDNATTAFGAAIAPVLIGGDCILLTGDIGAGKTAFARAVIQTRLGRQEDVPSPTFTIVQTYETESVDIWHCDLYRLTSTDEAFELGLDDAFETAICLIEWPDRLGNTAPKNAVHMMFETCDDGRQVTVTMPDGLRSDLRQGLQNV
jgi:tRNA threonylcarbamoyladenosine biosynthesis protein TsaE